MACPHAIPDDVPAPLLRLRAHPLRIALVGNPNVGKSVIFGRLTGRYATVSNYPGTTVTVTSGRALIGAEVCDVIDTPGVNTLRAASGEQAAFEQRWHDQYAAIAALDQLFIAA